MKVGPRNALLVLLAALLINAPVITMILLGWTSTVHTRASQLLALFSGAWLGGWLGAWRYVWQGYPWLLPVQLGLLLAGLAVWFWRPSLLTAALLTVAAMYAGPVGVLAFGYPEYSVPIAGIVLLPAFVLHIAWRKPVPGWLKFYFDA